MNRKFATWICCCVLLLAPRVHSLCQNITFDYLNGEKKVEIPFEFKNNFIIIKATLNRVLPLNFIFDTGAQHSLIFKKQYTDLLGAQYDRRIQLLGSDLSQDLYAMVTRNLEIEIPGVISFRKDLLVLEEDYFRLDEVTGMYIDGLLGGETFKHYVVKIDYRKSVLTLQRKDSFNEPKGRYSRIPIEIVESKPYLRSKVILSSGDSIEVNLLMDTGAGLPILLYTNTHADLKLPEKTINGKLGKGLGGFLEGFLGRINTLELGDFEFNNMIASFQEIDTAILARSESSIKRHGIVGNQLLSRFHIVIDYLDGVLYLRPERKWKKGFAYDRSGILVFAVGHELKDFLINSVLPNSPASEARVRKGDVIKKINGIPTSFLSLSDISRWFQRKEGRRVKLVVLRNGRRITIKFRLRDLL